MKETLRKLAIGNPEVYQPVYSALYEDPMDFSYLDTLERIYYDETVDTSFSFERESKIKHPTTKLKLEDDLYLGKIIYVNKVLEDEGFEDREFQTASDRAKKLFVLFNTYIPRKIVSQFNKPGLDEEDLLQEGTIKLMISADKYDFRKGYMFVTYASWWIKQGMREFVHNNAKTIRRPTHIINQIVKMNQAKTLLTTELTREPTLEEISEITDITVEKLEKLREIAQDTVSYHALNSENDDCSFENLMSDNSMEDELLNSSVKGAIKDALSTLTEREQTIISLRYGLNDGYPMTLEEVGNEVNLTKERVRQIESKALRNLRHPTRRKFLKDYM